MKKLFICLLIFINFNAIIYTEILQEPKVLDIKNEESETPSLEDVRQYQLDIIKTECIKNPKYGYSNLEVYNLIEALNYIKELNLVNKTRKDITLEHILNLHKLILKDINDENAGKLRTITVMIENSTYKFPDINDLPKELDNFIKWLQSNQEDVVKIAIDAHLKFVNIHPFYDGNGRMARLIMNIILIQANYVPFILDIEKRGDYLAAIKKAQLDNDLSDYYNFFLKN